MPQSNYKYKYKKYKKLYKQFAGIAPDAPVPPDAPIPPDHININILQPTGESLVIAISRTSDILALKQRFQQITGIDKRLMSLFIAGDENKLLDDRTFVDMNLPDPPTLFLMLETRTPETDKQTLIEIYNKIDDTGIPQEWITSGAGAYSVPDDDRDWKLKARWDTREDAISQWDGIETDSSGFVIGLSLPNNRLKGDIPEEISKLHNLERLDLSQNGFIGNIPTGIYDLVNLTSLNLGMNLLTDIISPDIGNLLRLQELVLHSNLLGGIIPPNLSALTNLQELSLSRNQLGGPIPVEIYTLVQLEVLGLAINNLTGPILPDIGNLIRLKNLYLYDNNLSGSIPDTIMTLTRLNTLFFYNNNLDPLTPIRRKQFKDHLPRLDSPSKRRLDPRIQY